MRTDTLEIVEQRVVAYVLHNNAAYHDIAHLIKVEYFTLWTCAYVWREIENKLRGGDVIDEYIILTALKNNVEADEGILEFIGAFTHDISKELFSHCLYIREQYRKRKIREQLQQLIEQTNNGELNQVVSNIYGELLPVVERNSDTQELFVVENNMLDYIKDLEYRVNNKDKIVKLTTGIKSLDKILDSLRPGEMTIIAARPSVGKSMFAGNICLNNPNKVIALFSMEMTNNSILDRLLSTFCHITNDKMRTGELDASDWSKLASGVDNFKNRQLFLNQKVDLTIDDVVRLSYGIKRQVKTKQLDLIIIDHIKLLTPTDPNNYGANEYSRISEYSRKLKILAGDLNTHVIVISQLNRTIEKDKSKTRDPVLSDLHGSGSLEQDADNVLLLNRDVSNSNASEVDCVVKVAKQRNGSTGLVKLRISLKYWLFKGIGDIYED